MSESIANVLEISHVGKSFMVDGEERVVLQDVTFSVGEQELLCVVGPSGSGKSTLLKIMSGLLKPTSGSVVLEGDIIIEPPSKLAMVFQEYSRSLLPWMDVQSNVTLPLTSAGMSRANAKERAAEMLEAVGLSHTAKQYPWQLSGGMQQRVAIARALAYMPDILLMDEPFAAVDAQTRMELQDLVLRLQAEFSLSILFVTHDIDEAVYLGQRVIALTKTPTVVAREVTIDLPLKRDQIETKRLDRFGTLRAELMELIAAQKMERAE